MVGKVISIYMVGHHQLLEVINTANTLRLGLCARQSRQQHRSQDGNDGDYNQKFNQGEAVTA